MFYSHFLQALLLPCPQPITPATKLLLLQNLFFVLAHELQPCLALDLMADLPPQACPRGLVCSYLPPAVEITAVGFHFRSKTFEFL